jgi:GDP-fucose transporter C1
MNYYSYKFPYPLFLTWFQFIVALVSVVIMGAMGTKIQFLSFIPVYKLQYNIANQVLPLTLVYVTMICLSNLCLQYVQASFYQVARAMHIIFNVILSYFILGTTTNANSLACCGVVILGYIVGAVGMMDFTWLGLAFGVAASLFTALHSIYVKKKLAVVNNDEWSLLIYNTTISVIILPPVFYLSGEWSEMFSKVTYWDDQKFWALMILAGLLGFLINIASFLQIKHTSPLTHMISGTRKGCLQTVLAMWIFGNDVSAMELWGTFICITGTALYSLVRYFDMKKPPPPKPVQPTPTPMPAVDDEPKDDDSKQHLLPTKSGTA